MSDLRRDVEPAPGFFRSHTAWTIAGLASIVAVAAFTATVSHDRMIILIAVASVTLLVGIAASVWAKNRWEQAGQFYEMQKRETLKWSSRYRSLQTQSEQTEIVLSQLNDGVVLLSGGTEILIINDSARRLLALSTSEAFIGRRFSEIVRIPELIDAVDRASTNQNASIAIPRISIEIISGANTRLVSVLVNRVSDVPGSNVILVVHDETEAQRVEAIRREFIANVSHELKTPLAAIKGYAETVDLAIDDDHDAAKHFVRQINTQCVRLEQLVSDMMQLARAQSGDDNLRIEAISLTEIVRQTMATFQPIADAKGVHLSWEPTTVEAMIQSDRDATLTIAQNLLSNAIRYTPSGGNVRLSLRQDSEHWSLVVSDDGVGIDESEQDRIFERFYRVSKTREPTDGGTGIGLSIVKNLTRALGGNVRVSSCPGKGATFEVLLPATKE